MRCNWEEVIKELKDKNFRNEFLGFLSPSNQKYFDGYKKIKPFYEGYYSEGEYFGCAKGIEVDGKKIEIYVTEGFSSGEMSLYNYIEEQTDNISIVEEIVSSVELEFMLFYNNIDYIYKNLILKDVL